MFLEGHPVPLRTILIILKFILKSSRQIRINVFEQLADIIRGESSDLLQEIFNEISHLFLLSLEAWKEDSPAVLND